MQQLVHLKSNKRVSKGMPALNGFTIYSDRVSEFFKLLKENLFKIPDQTRFQLYVRVVKHWFLVDCFINKAILHTFTLDAARLRDDSHSKIFIALDNYFPNGQGKHFSLSKRDWRDAQNEEEEEIIYIQNSEIECPIFTLEHGFLISKMDPVDLYQALEQNIDTIHINPKTKAESGIKSISIRSIFTDAKKSEGLLILAPIFRCMQSRILNIMPEQFKNAKVSKDGDFSSWIKNNFVDGLNVGIEKKNQKYFTYLQNDKELKTFLPQNPFGFVKMAGLGITLLHNKSQTEIVAIINDLINELKKVPDKTNSSFLNFRLQASHFTKTNEVIKRLNDVKSESNMTQLVKNFTDIVCNFAGYLYENHSDRTWNILQNFFEGLENLSKPNEITKLEI